jgi:hypothetical protein
MDLSKSSFNKNGYEIRTDILAMALDLVRSEYSFKFNAWRDTNPHDPKTGEAYTTNGMPDVPGLDKVLDTAEKMYSFVNGNKGSSKQ